MHHEYGNSRVAAVGKRPARWGRLGGRFRWAVAAQSKPSIAEKIRGLAGSPENRSTASERRRRIPGDLSVGRSPELAEPIVPEKACIGTWQFRNGFGRRSGSAQTASANIVTPMNTGNSSRLPSIIFNPCRLVVPMHWTISRSPAGIVTRGEETEFQPKTLKPAKSFSCSIRVGTAGQTTSSGIQNELGSLH
jgi:hypothetical protein